MQHVIVRLAQIAESLEKMNMPEEASEIDDVINVLENQSPTNDTNKIDDFVEIVVKKMINEGENPENMVDPSAFLNEIKEIFDKAKS